MIAKPWERPAIVFDEERHLTNQFESIHSEVKSPFSWSRFPEDLKLPDHKTKLFRNLSGPVQAGRGSLEGKLMLVLVELGS